jgi:hypothetical protein
MIDALRHALNLPVEERHYPDSYTVMTVFSPTGVPLLSFGFVSSRFVGTSAELGSDTLHDLVAARVVEDHVDDELGAGGAA